MLNTKYTRTTITLPEELLFEIKKKALLEKKTITAVINESLSLSLGKSIPRRKPIDINTLFGAWGIRYDDEKTRLKKLAALVIGSVSLKNHPEWNSKKKVSNWVRKIRSEWE